MTRSSLTMAAARNLATTTKSVPQMQGISTRWLLRMLPWVETTAGTYRVNARLAHPVGAEKIGCTVVGDRFHLIAPELAGVASLRGFGDTDTLAALAALFEQREYAAGERIIEAGAPVDRLIVIAHGKATLLGEGRYGGSTTLGILADGDHVGAQALTADPGHWDHSLQAVTVCTVMTAPRQSLQTLVDQSTQLREHIQSIGSRPVTPMNRRGEADIAVASGHAGEPALAGSFADYEPHPREYELHVAQTILRVHTRVADLYNDPMNQVEQQLRLTIEALRERQEHELVNNPDIGLLHNVAPTQRFTTATGPPTPDDLDNLITRRRRTRLLLAHPLTIAAFGRQCNKRGIYPLQTQVQGRTVHAWRGIPLLPCDKIPITAVRTSSILAMRLGEEAGGVIGLRQTGLPQEHQPGLSVRFMGISEQAIMSYLVSTYYSLAVLVPDALGILEHAEI